MSQPLSIELHASGVETANGSGAAVDMGLVASVSPRSAAKLEIAVTAFADVERVRLVFEHAALEAGPWLELDELDLTQTGDHEHSVGDAKRWLRVSWELFGAGSSPSLTFSVAGKAHQVYVSPRSLQRVMRVHALEDITTPHARAGACISVSSEADGYLGGRYTLPLKQWDDTLTEQCARIAIRYALDACGWQPDGPDGVVEKAFDRAIAWLKRLQDGKLEPPEIVDSTPEVFEGGSVVVSRPRRRPI